jgi:transcriptional regulator with PAS, ATPase and Fis domain
MLKEKYGCPGLLLVFSGTRPYLLPVPLRDGCIELGRNELQDLGVPDERVSRRHLAVQTGSDGHLVVRDMGSTNGVFLDGQRVSAQAAVSQWPVLRIGRTVLLLVTDISSYKAAADRPMMRDGIVSGPSLHTLHEQVAALAKSGQGLLLRGESGVGKEIAARLYHRAGPRSRGPLLGVNCAAIPKDLAERLLFGTVRGAYTGAVTDAQGHLQAACGGTLFLDEIAELDLSVQAKLLRALETREVVPLGGTRPQPIDLGLCAATLRDLREAVRQGRFREDLYYRIGRPEVRLPPLRARPEEIPYLIVEELQAAGRVADPSLVAACLLRPWPGNIRELRAEVRAAAARASAEGSEVVLQKHLDDDAGQGLMDQSAAAPPLDREACNAAVISDALLRVAGETLGLAQKTVLKLLPPKVLLACDAEAKRDGLGTKELGPLLRTRARDALFTLLDAREFNQSEVAGVLGTSRTTLIKLMDGLELPRASDLSTEEITRALDQAGGHLDTAARLLHVSAGALKRRLAQLAPRSQF